MKREETEEDRILVINSGSSSVKYQLLSLPAERVIAQGLVDDIGGGHSRHIRSGANISDSTVTGAISDHDRAFRIILQALSEPLHGRPLAAIGHRVVHGGERFVEPTRIDRHVLAEINDLSVLAPLHNPGNVLGIRICLELFPEVPQVAVFDTTFHRTLPDYAYRYAIPDSWYRDYGIRRYGFHGSSHRYVAQKAAEFLKRPLAELNLITLHLGNGASVSAIENGRCVDTSMGFTPLEGLVMGSRCGDIDASIPLYIQQVGALSPEQVHGVLNHQAGLKGLAGTNDVRELLSRDERGDEAAALALAAYVYRIRKYIGAYSAVLGRLDALVFTGGVGEHAPKIRSRCCRNLELLGITIDDALNNEPVVPVAVVSRGGRPVRVLVICTNEELQIAYDAQSLLQGRD
ncbi:MAG: acetate/propionate family kinase [Gammaproteobacteria bacterium]